ncbi:MAG: uroporphyrinogen-III synthase [Thermoanaerobaculaceae bacterium]|nr:uroporphyrinogen-III synthase [Thermoanaerobaculaceae bacterium]
MTRWVLVTRSEPELVEYAGALARHGVQVHPFPVLVERAVDDPQGWAAVGSQPERFQWLALTSPRAAQHGVSAAGRHALAEVLARLPVAAVGQRTAELAQRAGLRVELVGQRGAAALAATLASRLSPGGWVLHLCSRQHRPELAQTLQARGVHVLPVPVYEMEQVDARELPPLPPGTPVAVLLTSPRAALAYLEVRQGVPLACPHLAMGETTAAAAAAQGLAARALAQPTVTAFEEEICRILS